ncbi:DUF1684 domain-containing protein [Silvibacterium dinghuense]|uniref:DUF1684 domain-containing protein n=1 Tax=Silvibacterium dinghuense TaxID=1560006 RepID=A0A4Q1SB43_9BACT|nr:DUF1684 domain-containing protein [Silvibacterium dinghuense]RXS94364.1 DUF1684 domain-containing protein [Silvibacterium dinghuense]GGH16604.1 hypothetical protein GCM10011586_38550 [Silvibacterium dinghuense]
MNVSRVLAALAVSAITLLGVAETPSTWKSDLLSWRAQHEHGLASPNGWLTLVGLDWLKPGENTIGAAGDNQLQLPGTAPAHLGVIELNGGTIRLKPPAGGFPSDLEVNGAPATATILSDDHTEHPTTVSIGSLSFYVIHRSDRYAIRIKDTKAPTLVNFHGLHWYEANPRYIVHARWVPYHPHQTLRVPSIVGTINEMDVPGEADFTVEGKTVKLLPVVEGESDKKLFFIVRDATSGKTSYGAARFLYTDLPDHGLDQSGTLTLDFNRLQNPPCAYTPYATCPLPPPQNRLAVALPVGEEKYSH